MPADDAAAGVIQKKWKLRVALRAAVDVIELVNSNKRKFPDGTVRKDVKTGLADQHAHNSAEGNGWDSYISAKSAELFEWMYSSLGTWVGKNNNLSFCIGLMLCLSGIPGTFLLEGPGQIVYLKMDTSSYSNFALTDHPNTANYEYTRLTYNNWFHNNRFGQMIFKPKNGQDAMSKEFSKDVIDTLNHIQFNMMSHNKTFQDYCLKDGNDGCTFSTPYTFPPVAYSKSAVDLLLPVTEYGNMFGTVKYTDESVANTPYAEPNEMWEQWAKMRSGLLTAFGKDFNFNGMFYSNYAVFKKDEFDWKTVPVEQWRSKMMVANWFLDYHVQDTDTGEKQIDWETEVTNYVNDERYPHKEEVEIFHFLESSVELETARMGNSAVPMMIITSAIMVIYAETFLCTQVRIDQGFQLQVNFVSFGSNISVMAGLGSLGWMAYLGFKINVLCTFVIFLILCVGVDCIFIYVSAMKAVGPDVKDLAVAMSMCMAEAATACTLTGLTSVCAFFLSAAFSTNLPGMFVFNIAMGFAMLLNFGGFLLCFTGLMINNEKRMLATINDFTCKKMKRPLKPIPRFLTVGDKLRALINTKYAPLFRTSFGFKAAGATVMFVCFVVAISFVPSLTVGMADKYLMLDTSYLYGVFDDVFDDGFGNYPPTTAAMLVEHLDVNDAVKLEEFHYTVIETLYKIPTTLFVSCGPDAFYTWKTDSDFDDRSTTTWDEWMGVSDSSGFARRALFGGKNVYYYTETGLYSETEVPQAFMCTIFYTNNYDDFAERIDEVNEYNQAMLDINADIAEDCYPCNPLKITIGSLVWAQTIAMDENIIATVWTTIIVAVSAVAIVLFLALPITRAIISAANIFLIVINILGFMAMIGCGYNSISFATLSMAIGFCVDYTVETMHFSVVGDPKDPPPIKFESALKACGYDVLHGCATAFIGVMMINFVPSQAMRWFGQLSMIMCLFGGSYALWCLPSVIILLSGLGSMKKKPKAAATGTKA